ncbi:MAG: tryptophan 2,3-dioxygenase family protein [Candidatus Kapaibacterium sp.]
MELTYSNYLKIDEIKQLQQLKSAPPEHDEMLFIIIHQVYELWFKQILHESDELCKRLSENRITAAQKTLKRINTILKVLVHQLDVLETMTPLEFLTFRNYLESASGFQSTQFREVEFLLGFKDSAAITRTNANPTEKANLEKRYESPSLWDVFLKYLKNNSYEVPDNLLNRDYRQRYEPNQEVRSILLDIYNNSPVISQFCELLLDLDEGLQEWRYRHVQMVQRTIGAKIGTGGSSGAEYLKSTLFRQAFPDLWIIRAEFSL